MSGQADFVRRRGALATRGPSGCLLLLGSRGVPERCGANRALLACRLPQVGAGVAGLQAARHLLSAGFSVMVIEQNAELGGTWLRNYHGATSWASYWGLKQVIHLVHEAGHRVAGVHTMRTGFTAPGSLGTPCARRPHRVAGVHTMRAGKPGLGLCLLMLNDR